MTCAPGASEPTTMPHRFSSLQLPLCTLMVAASMATSAMAQQAQQQPPPPRAVPSTTPPADTPPPSASTFAQSRRALPQGFSVVLVLGDIQGTTTADDVPPAARKALVDMREFLPFKSYKLLDAAWVMCCGQQGSNAPVDRRPAAQTGVNVSTQMLSQVLRGPEEQEYELKLMTSRADGGRVFVRFTLLGGGRSGEAVAEVASAMSRTTVRRIADLTDQRTLLEKQIQEARKKYEVGVAPGSDVAKLEMELRRLDREIADLSARVAEGPRGRSMARAGVEPAPAVRGSIIDTSFTMDVGETVVVGTSRLKGGSRALIALLTAVPPRGTTERKE